MSTNTQSLTPQTAPPPNGETKVAVTAGASLLAFMANRYGLEPARLKDTLIKTVFPSGALVSNEQIAAFLVVAKQYDLNPFIKEIYAFPGKGGGIIPIVSIDGWLTLINRQPTNDGIDFEESIDDHGNPVSITTIIYRKDRSHPIRVTEYLNECKKQTEPWTKWPMRMLRHKSLIQCARVAFGFAGIYDPDEAERIAEIEGPAPQMIGAGSGRTKSQRLAEQLAGQSAAIVEPDPEPIDVQATETQTGPAELVTEEAKPDNKADEKKEKQRLRKVIEKYMKEQGWDENEQNRFLTGEDLLTMSLDRLNEFAEKCK